jgi:hypothetical protein
MIADEPGKQMLCCAKHANVINSGLAFTMQNIHVALLSLMDNCENCKLPDIIDNLDDVISALLAANILLTM